MHYKRSKYLSRQQLLEKLDEMSAIDGDTQWDKGYDEAISQAFYYANQLKEPKIPEVPKEIAEWFEFNITYKKFFEGAIYDAIIDMVSKESDEWEPIHHFLSDMRNKGVETIIMMKENGYIIRKEEVAEDEQDDNE